MPEIKEGSFNFTEKQYKFTQEEIIEALLKTYDYKFWNNFKKDDRANIKMHIDRQGKLDVTVTCRKPL